MFRQVNYSVNQAPTKVPPTTPMKAQKPNECNDIAEFVFPSSPLDGVAVGEAELDLEVVIFGEAGATV